MESKEMNGSEMEQVVGGVLSIEDQEWLMKLMRNAKKQDATLEEFLQHHRATAEQVEFCKSVWNDL